MTTADYDPWAADLEREQRDQPRGEPAPAPPLYEPLPESVLCVRCHRWRTLHPSRWCYACRPS
jgi:hypothetical protein